MGQCQTYTHIQGLEKQSEMKNIEILPKLPTDRQILLIQAKIRGFLARKSVEKLKLIEQPHIKTQETATVCKEITSSRIEVSSKANTLNEMDEVIGQFESQRNLDIQKIGTFTGTGKYNLSQGGSVEGEWKNGFLHGQGIYLSQDGSYYKGQWEKGAMHGEGIFYNSTNGHLYEGQWYNNVQHGIGTECYSDTSKYHGCFKNGLKDGKGTFSFADGSFYIGDFVDDKFEGQGVFVWERNQKQYQGEWIQGKKHGFGILTVKQKYVYEGNYKYGLKNGYGKLKWDDGRLYDGYWKDGFQHGQGKYIDNYGQEFKGSWNYGVFGTN